MSMMLKDWFLRQIHILEEALRISAERRLYGQHQESLEVLLDVGGEIFGGELELIDAMDVKSAIDMIGDADRIELYARYLFELAAARKRAGQLQEARRDADRSREILLHLERTGAPVREETLALLKKLRI
jgi:hypothetical protein